MIDTIRVYVTDPELAPVRAHPNDAGFDLRIAEDVRLSPGQDAIVGTGVHMAIPTGHTGIVSLRSRMTKLDIEMPSGIGVIDSDYRGEIKVSLKNGDDSLTVELKRAERVAQLLVVPIELPTLDFVADKQQLGATERGSGGFGSTGSI